MRCEVSSTAQEVMISRKIRVPSYKDICGGEKRKVNIGYNHDPGILSVKNNTLINYPESSYIYGRTSALSEDWEVLSKFFSIHNIEPTWLNCNYTWGWYDEELGGWTGCMGKV